MVRIAHRAIGIGKKHRGAGELQTICLDPGRNGAPRRGASDHHATHQVPPVGLFLSLEVQTALLDATDLMRSACESYRSEEHTSELQSPMYLVCRLLLEKKKIY